MLVLAEIAKRITSDTQGSKINRNFLQSIYIIYRVEKLLAIELTSGLEHIADLALPVL